MSGHKHAALMAKYAKDAAETDKPWERWELRGNGGTWVPLCCNPVFDVDFEYRRKPKLLEAWVNVYEDGSKYVHDTEEQARKATGGLLPKSRTVHMREVVKDE